MAVVVRRPHRASWVRLGITIAALVGLLAGACNAGERPATSSPPAQAPVAAPPTQASAAAPAAATTAPAAGTTAPAPAAALKPLKVSPEQGYVGTKISLTAEGLPSGKPVEFVWSTVDGSYDLKPLAETIEFNDRQFTPKRVALGRATADANGRATEAFAVPEDYGETHDIYAVVDGQDVARGGFYLARQATVDTLKGPVGSLLTIQVKGLGWTPYGNTLAVLWDQSYVGFISAVTTRGSAVAQIRAAGPPGRHVLRVTQSSAAVPYLNREQSPVKHQPEWRFDFAVTEDAGPPPATLSWPDRVVSNSSAPKTTAKNPVLAGASLSPSSGPILSKTTLQAPGLTPDASIDIYWVSAKGNRLSPSGWNLIQSPIGKATVAKDGTLKAAIDIPDDLGGWHVVKLAQGEKVLGEVPYYVERSLATVSPTRVRAGETFQVQIKGVGWTELDNTVTVLYDNSYMGYACGFNSQGDVTLNLVAYGQPGTHLIDLYPTIFGGHGKGPWLYNIPQLTFAQDHPSLALGYRLPAFRLAVQVVE